MTEDQQKEFEFNAAEIDKIQREVHATFMKYSELQLKLDRLTREQNSLFHKIISENK